jgi:hypothetical protein
MSDHPRGRLAGWILLALAGLALAVVLSVTASNLSTQPIGLSGEPLRAGDRLAPASVKRTPRPPAKKPKAAPPTTTTAPTQTATTTSPEGGSPTDGPDSDDRGSGRHRDADDD